MKRKQLAKRLMEEQKKFAQLNAVINQLTQEKLETQGKIILLQELLKDFETDFETEELKHNRSSSVQTERKKAKGEKNQKKEKKERRTD